MVLKKSIPIRLIFSKLKFNESNKFQLIIIKSNPNFILQSKKRNDFFMKATSHFLKFSLVVFVILFTSSVYAQTPCAPWIKLSKSAPKNLTSRSYTVPTKDEVGIRIYPGSYLTSLTAPRADTLKYENSILPFINLVTKDQPSKVISFYKSKLTKADGWNYNGEYKTFVQGDVASAMSGFVPAVGIRDETGDNFDLVYADEKLKTKLKTRIQIFYKKQ